MAVFNRSYTATQLAPVTFTPAASCGRFGESVETAPSVRADRNPSASLARWEGALSGVSERGEGTAASTLRGVTWGGVGDLVPAGAAGDGPGGEEALAPGGADCTAAPVGAPASASRR